MKKRCRAIIMALWLGGLSACGTPASVKDAQEELFVKTEPIEQDAASVQERQEKAPEAGTVPSKAGEQSEANPQKKTEEEGTDKQEGKTEKKEPGEEQPPGEAAGETEKAPLKESAPKDMTPEKKAYISVLEGFYREHSTPDGRNLGFNEGADISVNQFAIYDIDKDGKEELIVVWTTTIMAGMAEMIYDIDSASGTVREEFLEFPALTFYDNGVVEAELSHNHGLAGNADFWPYTLYQYDENADTYIMTAQVDAWNKEFYEKDHNGNPFPEEIDVNGDGVVYKITIEEKEKLMDLEEYKLWRASFLEGAQKVEIPFRKLTEENIYG